jgi:signal transduction histidine kinase/CheY-like chemotaxis protein
VFGGAVIFSFAIFVTLRMLPLRALDQSIGERDAAQSELVNLNASLEEEVTLRTADLKTAMHRAETANNAKSEFLSSMSHELRTPLNAILGFAQILELGKKSPLPDKQKNQVREIRKGGEHLIKLIDQILDLAKVESENLRLSIEVVDARELVNDCLSIAESLAATRGISIEDRTGDAVPTIWVDHLRSKQAILNLLSNAVKYNRNGGQVWQDAERHEETYRISVTDTGLGIPEDRQSELFMPFSRLEAENSDIQGTGIGLSLTKKLMDEMGGTVGFMSTLGEGSTFWVEMPFAEEGVQTVITEANDKDNVELNTGHDDSLILYVEDNPSNLTLMGAIVDEISNLTMISAHTAELGLGLAKDRKPDVIILDINLPGMDGFGALRHLQELEATRSIPVLALSADAYAGRSGTGTRNGFSALSNETSSCVEIDCRSRGCFGRDGMNGQY